MKHVDNYICAKCGSKTEDRFRVMDRIICEDCVEKHTKGDMPDEVIYNFIDFIISDLKIKNVMYIYKIVNKNKNFFVDSILKHEYESRYNNKTNFDNFKENFIEIIFNDIFFKGKYNNVLEDNKFYIQLNEELDIYYIEKEVNTYKKDYITYLVEYLTDNDYEEELNNILIEFVNAGYYRGTI